MANDDPFGQVRARVDHERSRHRGDKAAEKISADEMCATLGLTPANRGPDRKDPAAIQAVAVAEARARLG